MHDAGLKNKLTVAVSVLVVCIMCLTAFFSRQYFKKHFKEIISQQQFALITVIAGEIDDAILKAQRVLIDTSSLVTPEMVRDPLKARRFLDQQKVGQVFDNGIFLFDRTGVMVAESPMVTLRVGRNFAYRQYFSTTVANRKPCISRPYSSSQEHHHPAVMFTAPVFDRQGGLIGVLAGSVDLTKHGILGRIGDVAIGKTGYLYLYGSDRTIIIHPDRSRILKKDVPPGANRLFDKAIAGYEGTDENTNSRGIASLSSFKRLKTTDWIIAANYPVEEAYAAVFRAERYLAFGLLPAIALVILFIHFLMGRLLAPLALFARHVEGLTRGGGKEQYLPIMSRDEIGALARSFNAMMEELDRQRSALQGQLHFLQTLIDAIPAPIFYKDKAGRYLGCNTGFLAYLDRTREEVVGKSVFEVAPPHLAEIYAEADRSLMRHAGLQCYETSVLSGDGTLRDVMFYKATFANVDGTVGGVVGTLLDITERKKAEETLRRHNEYLAALNETTFGLISRHDIDSLLQAIISRAGALMKTDHGYIYLQDPDGKELVKKVSMGVCETSLEKRITRGTGLVGRVWESGEPLAVDDYRSWADRLPDTTRDRFHAVVGVPLTSENRVIGVLGLAHIEEDRRFTTEEMEFLGQFGKLASLALDNARLYTKALLELQERQRVEDKLRKLSHAVEQSPAMVIITDTSGAIEYVNPKFIEATGYREEEVAGRNPRLLKSGETHRDVYAGLWRTITAGNEWRGELHNRKKNGELYWTFATISPIRDLDGKITHYLAVKEDITERKALENQLRHSQKMDAIGRMAGGIAHDFNNILTAIIGYASSLQLKGQPDTRLRSVLDQIIAAAERGAGLTRALLSFSRKQVTNPKAVNLNEIVKRIEKLLVRLVGEDIGLRTSLASIGPIVMADSSQIEQVLMNLVTNARDAMPEGGMLTITSGILEIDGRFALTHGYGEPGTYAILSVSDTGTGMDEETAKRIFEPFYTTKDVGKGTGLGLSIVYGIVKKHNGYITCYSEPGKGSVFTMYLPAVQEAVDKPCLPPEERFVGGTETILMAEDDGEVRKITRVLLEEHGYRVIEAVDGEEALAKFRKHWEEVQLLLLDVIMPNKNGWDVYTDISRMRPDIKVIFTSGYSADIVQGKGMLAEGVAYLTKPHSRHALLTKIREVLNQ